MYKVLICSLYVVLPRRRRGQNLTRREAARKTYVWCRRARTTPEPPDFIVQLDTIIFIYLHTMLVQDDIGITAGTVGLKRAYHRGRGGKSSPGGAHALRRSSRMLLGFHNSGAR